MDLFWILFIQTPEIPPEAGKLRTEMSSLKNVNEPVQPLQPRS